MPKFKSQGPVDPHTVADPTLAKVHKLFEDALGKDIAKSPWPKDFVRTWLQHPDDLTVGTRADSNCPGRAEGLSGLLNTPKIGSYDAIKDPVKGWTSVDALLLKGKAVPIKGLAGEVGGNKSLYKADTHHYVFVVAKGADFYVIFDPEVNASQAGRDAWAHAIAHLGVKDAAALGKLSAEKKKELVAAMLFGAGGAGLGALFRKHVLE